jgi:hypothetical protein
MVNDVPPPPLDEVSRGSRAVTAKQEEIVSLVALLSSKETISLPIVSTKPVNIVAGVTVLICKGKTKLGSVDLGFGAEPRAVPSAFWRSFDLSQCPI